MEAVYPLRDKRAHLGILLLTPLCKDPLQDLKCVPMARDVKRANLYGRARETDESVPESSQRGWRWRRVFAFVVTEPRWIRTGRHIRARAAPAALFSRRICAKCAGREKSHGSWEASFRNTPLCLVRFLKLAIIISIIANFNFNLLPFLYNLYRCNGQVKTDVNSKSKSKRKRKRMPKCKYYDLGT